MNWTIISGSPKGKYSITLQSALYLEKHHPEDEFTVFHAGQRIRKYEDDAEMAACIDAMAAGDVIVFAYPVYTFLATSQLARFIELLKAHPRAGDIAGKFATQITTSKHFYDTTAQRYVEDTFSDLGLKVIPGLPADMDDLLIGDGRRQLRDFYKRVCFSVENDMYDRRKRPAVSPPSFAYHSSLPQATQQSGFDTVIVSDCANGNDMLRGMIDAFIAAYPYPVREVNIAEFPFQGGCLGCFKCASDGNCVYKDDFENLLREEVLAADAIFYAATIRDHSLGARFKCFHDRQFCNGHRVLTGGKVSGYILDGAVSAEENLRDVIESRADVGQMTLAGIATNESGSSEETDASVFRLAQTAAFSLENRITRPQSFWGVCGTKIFRDLIYTMRGLMRADHKHYKRHGVYDFPHKRRGMILGMKLVGLLMRSKTLRKKAGHRMNEAMIWRYKRVMDKE